MNKTIVITGASAGIGKATARYFADKGWNVAATMRSPQKETELVELDNVKIYKLDVTNQQSIEKAYKAIINDFKRVDVLLNNAGYGLAGPFELSTDEQIRREFDVNMFGLFNTTKMFLPHFRANKSGIIINVSSVGGKVAFPILSTYHATKFAVEGFTESLAYELVGLGIKVKLIEPGSIATNFSGSSMDYAERLGQVEDYTPFVTGYTKQIKDRSADYGGTPDMVTEVIFEAATDKTNRIRYVVGEDAKQYIEHRNAVGDEAFVEGMMKNLRLLK